MGQVAHATVAGADGQPACTCGARCWAHIGYWPTLRARGREPCAGELQRTGKTHHCTAHGHWADDARLRPTDNSA